MRLGRDGGARGKPLQAGPVLVRSGTQHEWRPLTEATAAQAAARAPAAGPVALPEARPRLPAALRELLEIALLALLLALAARSSIQNFQVEGVSMEPGLQDGELLIVNKLAYARIDLSMFDWLPAFDAGDNPIHHLWGAPGRGDVVVFRSPTALQGSFVKRIIGLPGDTVLIEPDTGRVRVNGRALEEPYALGKTACTRGCQWTVPPGSYFVLGDNRQASTDSRQGWFVPAENVTGKVLLTYWRDGRPELDLIPGR